MAVTNYSEHQHGDPDVEVQFDHEGRTVTGFIDARRQHDGVWEAWVWFSYDDNGWRATRKDWIRMDQLTVLTIDDAPADQVTTPAATSPSRAASAQRSRVSDVDLRRTLAHAMRQASAATDRRPGPVDRASRDIALRWALSHPPNA